MFPKDDQVIGIVGGMGPQAGNALLDHILRNTHALHDQQHLPVVLMSFPALICDRTAFLEGREKRNPAFDIAGIIRKLEAAGATLAGLACNTSYVPAIYNVVLDELEKTNCQVKMLHMPSETCGFLQHYHKHVRRIGIMATNGTYKSGLYKHLLQEWGYEVIVPDPDFQDGVIHRMIYDKEFGIKSTPHFISSEVRILTARAMRFFRKKKADAIVLGCTELSLAITQTRIYDMAIIDSIEALAKAFIREAYTAKRISK